MILAKFTTKVDNEGKINIPEEQKNILSGRKIHVILREEEKPKGTIADLIKVIQKYGNSNLFKGIDPVKWQKKIREEWDRY